jgi:magnesium-transporting ATPase (P-type)
LFLFQALKKFDPERATVLRDGKISEINAAELVPGKHIVYQNNTIQCSVIASG